MPDAPFPSEAPRALGFAPSSWRLEERLRVDPGRTFRGLQEASALGALYPLPTLASTRRGPPQLPSA